MHYSGGGGQTGAAPALASGYPSMRMKRPRDAESGDEFAGAEAHSFAPSGDATLSHTPSLVQQQQQQQPPPHLHLARHSHPSYPHHTMLPPIRSNEGSQQMASPALARPAGSSSSSLHLVSPTTAGFAHGGQTSDKGKGVASEFVGASDSSGAGGSAQPARGNRDAQPTQLWLASQRHYKTALLHLLSLESFYPSDIAMLNMFRSLGDFTADQVEIHGATLLSWARSWLRYTRNAVLRSTLDNRAKDSIKQLAEALQHDLHAETDFTTPPNIRRCTLLRLIYFQWQSVNKLGTKSQSMYRDYESRLREIEALPTSEDQEREWERIVSEERQRRLDIIKESRLRSETVVTPRTRPRPEQVYQPNVQMNVAPPSQLSLSAPASASASGAVSATMGQFSELAHGTSAMQQ
ncbi:hypothetical protein GGI21_005575, partial [Coemansia aciculifera]